MALSKTTQDHDTIRSWAEARGAKPVEVSGTNQGEKPGILRFAFPKAKNHKDENLSEISWDEFFEKFDESGLELVYQEKTAEGEQSNFNKLIYPEDEHAQANTKASAKPSTSSRTKIGPSGKAASSGKSGSSRKKKAA